MMSRLSTPSVLIQVEDEVYLVNIHSFTFI